MGDKESIDRLIDKQINGTITDMELMKLDLILKENPKIAEELQLKMEISKAMNYIGNQELKSTLEKIHKEEIDTKPIFRLLNLKRILGVAAVFLGGLLIFQFAFNNRIKTIDEEQIFTNFYKPYQASFQTRDQSNDEWIDYKSAYTSGNYKEALTIITPNLKDVDNEILLSAGISALEVGNLDISKNIFMKIIESKDYYYKDHAGWYVGLIYLKQNKSKAATELFQLLATDLDADHHQEAKDILSQLKAHKIKQRSPL